MSSWVRRGAILGLATIVLGRAIEVPLSATVGNPVPEIDGGSLAAGMALLAAGVLVLRARRRTK